MDLRGGGLAVFFGGSLLSISLVTVNVFENKIKRAIGLVGFQINGKDLEQGLRQAGRPRVEFNLLYILSVKLPCNISALCSKAKV